jgi:protocatechuate 3,4-dioxygenase beta subunit
MMRENDSKALVVHGRVRDTDGSYVSGAQVWCEVLNAATGQYSSRSDSESTRTDATGSFAIVQPTAWGRLMAKDDIHTTLIPFEVNGVPSVMEGTIIVGLSFRYAGRVVSVENKPVRGAHLTVEVNRTLLRKLFDQQGLPDDRQWEAATSQTGAFALDDVAWHEGVGVRVDAPCYRSGRHDLPGYNTESLVIVLQESISEDNRIGGFVVDEDGKGIEGAIVVLASQRVTCDSMGHFEIGPRSSDSSEVLAAGATGFFPKTLIVEPGGAWEPGARIVLKRGSLEIRGRVCDEAGTEIKNAWVWISDPSYPAGGSPAEHDGELALENIAEGMLGSVVSGTRQHTDSRGNFRLYGLLDRPYTVVALSARTMATATLPDVMAGSSDIQVILREDAEATQIAGCVVDIDKHPIAGVRVYYGRHDINVPLITDSCPLTDSAGLFQLVLAGTRGAFLEFDKDDLARGQRCELGSVASPSSIMVTLLRNASFQIHLTVADGIVGGLLRRDDNSLVALSRSVGLRATGEFVMFGVTDGLSDVIAAPEGTYWCVLCDNQWREQRRLRVTLTPGGVSIIGD